MVAHRELPRLSIGSIERTMNFAFVRMEGDVVTDPRTFRQNGRVASVSFTIDDGTGDIDVKAYRAKAQALVDRNLVPRQGDRVEVAGNLSVSMDGAALWLASADQIRVERQIPLEVGWREVSAALDGKLVSVQGVVLEVQYPKVGSRTPWRVDFTDGTGVGRMVMWEDTYLALEARLALEPGLVFRALGSVDLYRGRPQIRLLHAQDLQPDPRPPQAVFESHLPTGYAVRAPGEITRELEGRMVAVSGRVAEVERPPPGSRGSYRIRLQEGEAELEIMTPRSVGDQLPPELLHPRRRIRVVGLVQALSDRMRVRIFHPGQYAAEG
jgi:DNA/RNA endonuclease YhcR with UshA esterase domain